MSSIDLSRFEHLKATDELPSPKEAALAIVRQTQCEDCSLADLARVAGADPAFVGRLLKAANSVHAGSCRPVASIRDAMAILGIPAVRSLALGFSLVSGYRNGGCAGFDYPQFWSRSLAVACAFQLLTSRTRAVAADESFAVGLLANVGQLALATLFPDQFARVIAQSDGGTSLLEREQQAFSLNHNELSAAMLVDWGLPRVFTDPVCYREQPELAGFAEGTRQHSILWSLILANELADACLAADAGQPGRMRQLSGSPAHLALDAAALAVLADEVLEHWQQARGMHASPAAPLPLVSVSPQPDVNSTSGGVAPSADETAAVGMRCLVVDDDPSMRAILKSLLTGAGHEVVEAEDGRQGFETALELEPQIMIVDWLMPEMDGLELTRALRQTKSGRNVYILILTGLDEDDKLVQAFEAGVDDFMTKPLKPRLLAARLRAGQRMVRLQHEIDRDREEIRRFAAELAITNRRVQEASLLDAQTGFPNRRHAIDRLNQEWSAATRSGRPLACMAIDVDHFKSINDRHSHETGDALLQQSAEILKAGLRAQDVVCRTGGDEFLVICPDTTMEAVHACAERVRKALDVWEGQVGSLRLRCTVSIGIAVRGEGMGDPDDLVKTAEQALRRAKAEGRNRVCGDVLEEGFTA